MSSLLIAAVFLFVVTNKVLADTMSSANFRIQADALSVGGIRSTSANFIADDSLSEQPTGEDLASASFRLCVGYECFKASPFVSFSVGAGTVFPGTVGGSVVLGTIPLSGIATSDGVGVNSFFVSLESNAPGGTGVTVRDSNSGLARASSAGSRIDSASATLAAGTAGYGLCVFSTSQNAASPAVLSKTAPYNGTCTKSTGHAVGLLDATNRTILSTSGALKGGQAEILVKAAISGTTPAGNDYQDTVTFIATGTY